MEKEKIEETGEKKQNEIVENIAEEKKETEEEKIEKAEEKTQEEQNAEKEKQEKEDQIQPQIQTSSSQKALQVLKEKTVAINLLLLALAILFAFLWFLGGKNRNENEMEDIGLEKAKTKILGFVQENMVQPGTEVEVKGVSMENGLYKADLNVQGQEVSAYLSTDGEIFYPQSYKISEVEDQKKQAQQQQEAETAVEVPKSEKPKVEAFIMSYCPYGTQIQKGLLPVLKALGSTIDFEFKFVDYAMHGEEEIEENIRQYCIDKDEPQKFSNYLSCFLKEGKSDSCLTSEKVNTTLLSKCSSETRAKFKIDEGVNDKSAWKGKYPPFNLHKEENDSYKVQGSPTLVVNGVQVQSQRDSASLLEKICSSFEVAPPACNQELSSTAPAPGFGEGKAAAAGSEGSCN